MYGRGTSIYRWYNELREVVTQEGLREAQRLVKTVKVSEAIKAYIVDLSRATRQLDRIRVGLSLRGLLAMMKAAQAVAAMEGRNYIIPDDVKEVIYDIGLHRLICKSYSTLTSYSKNREILEQIIKKVSVPTELL